MKNWLTRTAWTLRGYWPELAVALFVPGGLVIALLLLLRPRKDDAVKTLSCAARVRISPQTPAPLLPKVHGSWRSER